MSIGALSKATGVPVETLRTWERRYGFPSPARTQSGHRRYSIATLRRLKLATLALQRGHRPSVVLGADERLLRDLLRQSSEPAGGGEFGVRRKSTATEAPADMASWFEHVERFEGRALDRELRKAWAHLGSDRFLSERAGPFVVELGERWARGELRVAHEHFATERLREFLSALWRPLSDAATGPHVVLATLPGELHVLGLHMVAYTMAHANFRLVFLGADTPIDEIATVTRQHDAEAVAVSAARSADRALLIEQLGELRAALPEHVQLAVGGEGAKGIEVPGVRVASSPTELSQLV